MSHASEPSDRLASQAADCDLGAGGLRIGKGDQLAVKQSTLANVDFPVRYLAGATGDFERSAAWDSSASVEVRVSASASVTGSENWGDWDRIISGTAGDPGWVTTGRGGWHLNSGSAVVDQVTFDGDRDIDGNARPAGGDWDTGAVEYIP